jgi:4-amino-4-deoxy-L-arabinose transferase-like glycosyltransferase
MKSNKRSIQFLIAMAACLLALSAGLYRTGFTGKDELRYAQVAKEMRSLPEFFVMHYEGEIYPDKPPLYFWMARGAYALGGGVSPLGTRLPLLFCIMLTLLATFDIGRRLFGYRAGLFAMLFTGLCHQVVWSVHMTKLDPPLAASVALAYWVLSFGIESDRRPSLWRIAGFWLAMALGVLSKGPLALALPTGGWLVYRAWSRNLKGVVGKTTFIGAVVFLATMCIWILPALHFGGWEGYFRKIFFQELVERTFEPSRHMAAWYIHPFFYFGHGAYGFFPGSLFVPVAGIAAWRALRNQSSQGLPALRFVLSWLGFGLVFMTFMATMRPQYILPLYPALGLLVGWYLDRLLDGNREAFWKTLKPIAIVFAGVAGIIGVFVLLGSSIIANEFENTKMRFCEQASIFAISAGFAAASLMGLRRRSIKIAMTSIIGYMAILLAFLYTIYLPRAFNDAPYKELAPKIEAIVGPGTKVITYRKTKPELNIWGNYYTQAHQWPSVVQRIGLDPSVKQPTARIMKTINQYPERIFLALTKKQIEDIHEKLPQCEWQVLELYDLPPFRDEGGLYLLANRPAFVP